MRMCWGLVGVWGAGGAWGCWLSPESWLRSLAGPRGGSVTLGFEHKQGRRCHFASPLPNCFSLLLSHLQLPLGWAISCCWRWIMLMWGFVSHRSLPGQAELIPSSLSSPSSHPLAGAVPGWIQGGFWFYSCSGIPALTPHHPQVSGAAGSGPARR